jgi:trimeric autotransporter adhesin
MNRHTGQTAAVLGVLAISMFCSVVLAQQGASTQSSAPVPRMVNFTGKTTDFQGKAIPGIVGATFAIYKDQYEGSSLWLETQNVQADTKGNYIVHLGATRPEGLPLDLFSSGDARWLGVTVNGGQEQPRVLLLSVPYALKAADAETIGGLPPSAFVLAAPANGNGTSVGSVTISSSASGAPSASSNVTTTGGTVNALPLWTTATNVQSSAISQTGAGTTAKIGIGTTTPAATLDVKGAETVRGVLTLPATGTATATKGANSQPQDLVASSFSSSTSKAMNQTFQWQAEPATNNTANPSGTLNLLYGLGATAPSETGLKLSPTGLITFATGQTFPGTGTGTITGITTASGSGLAGGGASGTLNLTVPSAGVTNAMLQNSKITLNATAGGGLTAPGAMTLGGTSTIGLQTCAANQVLQYISGAWGCSTLATGGVTSVGLSAPPSDFAVSNSPVTGAGTLGLTWNVPPDFNNTPNAIVKRDQYGSFAANQITANSLSALSSMTATDITVRALYGDSISGGDGVFNGGPAPVGSNLNGVDGVDAYGGAADPNDRSSHGGVGVVGQGGAYNGPNNGYSPYGGNGVGGYGGNGSRQDGVGGYFVGGSQSVQGIGIIAFGGSGIAGYFGGNIFSTGTITGAAKNFKIDHPLDPANKYLVHASVESSELMNIYTGNVTTDAQGEATVLLPDWFEALNTDFRYQLTVIGKFAQAIVASEIENHQFRIRTNAPAVKVSWQVTGVRQDAYAKANPLVVEETKEGGTAGYYIHPELYGQPQEKSISWTLHPEPMKRPVPRPAQPHPAMKPIGRAQRLQVSK